MKVPFKNSKYANQEIADCPDSYLFWLIEKLDCNDPRFGQKNTELVAECNRVINRRAEQETGRGKTPAPSAPKPVWQAPKPASAVPNREMHEFLDRMEAECAEMRARLESANNQSQHRPV